MKALIAAAVSLSILSLSSTAALAGSPMPSHVDELQPAQAPEGARRLCETYAWACGDAGTVANLDEAAIQAAAREVNLQVNRRIRPQSDSDGYGIAEKWTLPLGGRGDCEDYALLKKKLLLERGVPADRLLLTVVIKNNLEPHAVLLLRGADADYLLDNMTDAILPWRLSGYTIVKMQSQADQSAWSAVLLGPLASRSGGYVAYAGSWGQNAAGTETRAETLSADPFSETRNQR